MKVSELAGLLDSLVQGLERVKGTASVTKDLKVFEPALRSFADRSVADFTSFLMQCEEYQRTGIVPGKKAAAPRAPRKAAGPELIAGAVQAVQTLLGEIQQGLVHEQRVEETLAPLQKLTKPQLDEVAAGLNIAGKAKTKAQALDRIRQVVCAQLEMHDKVRLIRDGGAPETSASHS